MHRLKYKICATAVDLLIFILFFFCYAALFSGGVALYSVQFNFINAHRALKSIVINMST